MKKFLAILALIVVILAAAVAYIYTRPRKPLPRPHIIVALIDTMRADHVGCYGYTRPTTPFIDSLAAKGTVYENVYPPTSWTLPSLATIFLGLNPQQHGITDGLQTMGMLAYQHQLSGKYQTLTERLAADGYMTVGYSTNIHITQATGFGQGFSIFREAATSNAEAVEQMAQTDRGRFHETDYHGKPYFLFMHFFDPHTPYLVREPYIKSVAPNLDTQAFLAANPMGGDLMNGFEPDHFKKHPEQLQALSDVYDSEIAAADAALGRIIRNLPGSDRAVIVVVSDHGEAFYEHESMLHGYDLYEETLRVPLVVRESQKPKASSPGGRRVSDVVGLYDIAPTILGYAGIPHEDLPGADINKAIPKSRALPLHLHRGSIQKHGAIIWPKKLIVDDVGGVEEVFDLQVDPLEKNPISPDSASDELQEAADAAGIIDPEIPAVLVHNKFVTGAEQIKTLGYLTGGGGGGGTHKATPTPTPWVVELDVCSALESINKECSAKEETAQKACVKKRLDELKEKVCHKASSYNYRKKCEFMRLKSALRICGRQEADKE